MTYSPYPPIYTPKGTPKPACCAHSGPLITLDGVGPDWDAETKTGGGGMLWGAADYVASPQWLRTAAGFWLYLTGQRPQDLLRTAPHPRVTRRRVVPGAHPGQSWSVPVLLTMVGENQYRPVIDGIWDGQGWTQGDLGSIFDTLLAFANEVPLGATPGTRDTAFRNLAISILAIDHWIDEPMIARTGWLSNKVMISAVLAAADVATAGDEMV